MFGIILIFVLTFYAPGTVIASQEDISSLSEIENKVPVPVYPSNQKNNLAFGAYSIPTYPDYVPVNSHWNARKDEESNSNVAPTRQAPLETWSSIIATSLVPLSSFALFLGAKAIVYTFKFIAMVLISVALTTSICTFTPICHITFAGIDFNKTQVAEVAAPYMTTENLNKGTVVIGRAIDAFKEIQRDSKKNIKSDQTEEGEITPIVPVMNKRRRRHV